MRKIPAEHRDTLERILMEVGTIAAMQVTQDPDRFKNHIGAQYAHALGRCNGIAQWLIPYVEYLLKATAE